MFLNPSKIHGPEESFDRTDDPSAFAPEEDDYRVVAPVALQFRIRKDKDRVRLTGRVGATLELPCSRCLEPFAWPVDATFDLCYLPESANTGEGEMEIQDDDLATAFYADDQIDLGQLLREQFMLSLPMKPLCQDDCRGLCPSCGINRTRGTCECQVGWNDPRLDTLRTLLKKDDDDA
jgi:uncharacterized protein